MQRALIIGSSGGIGAALVRELRSRGVMVTGLSRRNDGLDICNETSVDACFSTLDGPFDLIFVATGALELDGHKPEKSLKQLSADAMMAQFRVNAVGPALVMKHSLRLLPRAGRSVFAALSARVGSIGDNSLGGWYSYRTAKAGLNQMVHTASIELARTHKEAICVSLHPGTVDTALTAKYASGHPTFTPEIAAGNLISVIEGLAPENSGGFFDWRGDKIVW